MNLEEMDFYEMMQKNFLYEAIDDIFEQVISKLADPENINKSPEMFHSDKYLAVGLNKLIIDYNTSDVKSEGFLLIKAYLDSNFNIIGKKIEDYKPDIKLKYTLNKLFETGNLIDANLKKNNLSNKYYPHSSEFIHKTYLRNMRIFQQNFTDTELFLLKELKKSPHVYQRYFNESDFTPNPLQFFAQVINNKDVKTFQEITSQLNYFFGKNNEERYSKDPIFETEDFIIDLARQSDFGKHIKSLDYEWSLPSGPIENGLQEMLELSIYGGLEMKKNVQKAAFNYENNFSLN